MDSFFGIGLPELVLILILAGIVMGPHRIRHVARTLGGVVAQMQQISRQFARQLNAELDATGTEELRHAAADLKELQQEMANLRRQFSSLPQELLQEGKKVQREAEATLKPVAATNDELLRDGRRAARAAGQRFKQTDGEREEEARGEETGEQGAISSVPAPVNLSERATESA